MKSKHQNLAAVSVLLLSAVAAFAYGIYRLKYVEDGVIIEPQPVFSQVSVPTAQEIRAMGELKQKFSELALPEDPISKPVAMEIFGYHRSDLFLSKSGEYVDVGADYTDYNLTFTFSAGRRRFCMIDGGFYSLGGRLPDGAEILQIDAHKVLVQKKERQIWVPLAAPDNITDSRTTLKRSSKKAGSGE